MFIDVQCKIIQMAFFDTSLYWQGLVMFNFCPFYVSKQSAIIMLLVYSFIVVFNLVVVRVKCLFYCKLHTDCGQIHILKVAATV